ncbi:MAG: ABC transporter permease [Xanthobacteraceae bacterium]
MAACPTPVEIVIVPGGIAQNYWRELWRYRELFQVLAWRDVAIRYKQTAIGVAWAVVRPLLTMVVFTLVFSRLAKLPSDGGVPYAVMVLAGVLPWTFFATALSDASNSLVGNANLIGKTYFPRLIVPAAAILAALVDFCVGLLILAAMMVGFSVIPGWQLAFLPLIVLAALLTALGPSLWITAVNVRYRDFRFVVPFLVQLGLYVSPVGFGSNVVPERWRLVYSLNPMVGVIDSFRWCILGGRSPLYWPGIGVGAAVAAFGLWIGLRQFRKLERNFADLL